MAISGEGWATLDDGTFERRLDPGSYELTISVRGFDDYSETIVLEEGQRVELEVVLTPS